MPPPRLVGRGGVNGHNPMTFESRAEPVRRHCPLYDGILIQSGEWLSAWLPIGRIAIPVGDSDGPSRSAVP